MARLHRLIVPTACVSVLAWLSGCQSGYRSTASQIVSAERAGQYDAAASTAAAAARAAAKDSTSRVIYLLEAGRTAQIAGDVDASTGFYATAYDLVRPYLDTKADARVSEAITTTLVNQTLAEYRGTVVERIMLSTLQAINRLALGQYAEARIELNRARDWQQDAVENARRRS